MHLLHVANLLSLLCSIQILRITSSLQHAQDQEPSKLILDNEDLR